MATYQQAKAYYQKHADKDTIRKIQQFLAVRNSNGNGGVKQSNIGESFYNGDLDGIFGPETYKAILEYQKAMGTNADGMWGESTNSFHRVLNATNSPYRDDASGPSGAHAGFVRGVNTGQKSPAPRKKWATQNDMYRDIQALKERYYGQGGEDWFWSEDPSATQWREFLGSTPQGQDIFNEFYEDAVSRGKKPDRRLMTTKQKQFAYNTGVRDAINKGGRTVATVAGGLALPLSFAAAPLATVFGVAGGALGNKIGGDLAANLHEGDTSGFTTPRSMYRDAVTGRGVNPSEIYSVPTGAEGQPRIADTPGLVGSSRLHVGRFAPKSWRNPSVEFVNYLEGAGGNPAYSPTAQTMFSFKRGGILCRNNY